MGSIIGHKIDYNGVGALRGQGHIPNKNLPKYPPPPPPLPPHMKQNLKSGAPNDNIVQNHLNIALLNVF